MPDLLDRPQAARRCNLARASLAKLRVNGGSCPYFKVGAKVLYRAHDLARWIESYGRRRSTSEGIARQVPTAA